MFVLNYPCNDSPYFWHIVSVSKFNFRSENQYGIKVVLIRYISEKLKIII